MKRVRNAADTRSRFRRKGSFVVSVGLLYLAFTLTNLLIFWLAVGSDQINLIAENSVLTAKTTGFDILRHLQPLTDTPKAKSAILLSEEIQRIVKKKELGAEISHWTLFDSAGKVFFSSEKKQFLGQAKVLRALQAREYFSQPFIVIPDLIGSMVHILIPLQARTQTPLVFAVEIHSLSIQRQVSSFIRFGLLMSGILLFAQTIFGWLLYRRYARPILQLVRAAVSFTRRNFSHRTDIKRTDEIGYLNFSLNRLANSVKNYNEKLQETLKELRDRRNQLEFDLELGAAIQSAIMPAQWETPLAKILIFFRPLEEVSGDYYDFVNYPDGKLGVLLTDAMGHGVPAALLTIMAKIHFSNLYSANSDPTMLLSGMHQLLMKIPLGANYLTALFFLLKPDLTFQYAVACHMPGLIFRRQTGEISVLQGKGFLLGLDGPEVMDSISGTVATGDRILFFTDGLLEFSDESTSLFTKVQDVFIHGCQMTMTDCYEYLIQNLVDPYGKGTDDITFILMEIR